MVCTTKVLFVENGVNFTYLFKIQISLCLRARIQLLGFARLCMGLRPYLFLWLCLRARAIARL